MSIIIRLQNLPLSAKASDIRDFFSNLKIPKGAVNIVGGNEGDAFIGFATDEDARLAMRFEGKLLHNAQVKLLLSSKSEMDSVIASAHAMAKAESFSAGASIAPSSNLPVSAAHTKPFAADVPTPEGLKKDVKPAPFSFGLPASIAQISDHPGLAPQNISSTGEFGNGGNWNSHPQPVASQGPPSDLGRVSTGLPSDSWKTSSSSYPAFQASFLPPSYNGPPPSQQQSTEQSKLFYSNNNKAGMENQMYQQQQHQQPTSNIPTPNGFATAVIHNQQQQQQQQQQQPPQQQQQHPQPFVATQSIPSFPPNTNNHPFPSSTNNPPFSPSFVQHNPYSRDETRANTHSYQQHFDTPGARQAGPPAFAHSQYPLSPQEQGNGGMGSGPPKTQPFPQHTYEQQQQQTSTFSQQAPPKVAENALWMYHPPTNNQVVPEQKQFRNMGNDNGPFGQTSSKPPPSPTTNVYVELSRLPTELLRPANLEAFLSPTVPLTLSSVKVVHNPDGSVMHALVKFGCEEDAKRILHRNGDKGIKISPSSETSFNNAMDGILGAAAKPMVNSNKRSSPPAFPNNSSNQHGSNHNNTSDHQAKRGRRDPPGVWQSGNDNDSDHRHRQQPENKDRDRPAFNQAVRGNQPSSKKERVCVQLTNVPYKATYDNIRDFVCSGKSARYEKITRTYYTGKNLSDRWIIEFSNEKDASSVYKSRAEILGRRIHCEYLNPRAADDQYAIPEPDENRDRGGQQQHHRNAPFQQQRGPPRPAPVHPGHSQRQNRSPNTIPCDANRVELQQPRKKDSYSDIPNMTLEASTLDELITRGDLPPTSFGAFQSAVAPSVGVLRKTGFTSKLGVGNQFNNNAGPNPASFSPSTHTTASNNSNIPPRGADYQAGFPHGSSHPPFVPPPSNLSRSVPTWPGAAPGQKQARQSPPRDPLHNFEFPKFRPKPQIHDPAPKNGLLPHPSNSSHPNDTGEEESPVPLFSIKFQNGPAEKADPRKQPANSLDCTLNSTCDTENGRLMIADDSAMSSASGLSIAASTASSSMEKMNPYISFLDRARENGEERTAIRLENVQKLVIAEKLCQFLGVQLVSPSENIARMPDGSLYVNLSNEDWASKAASRNGAFLERNKIFIQQISKSQMAEAIRRNLLNAPKPSEHALVARGFDRSTTANQVAQFFEKFHPLTVSLLPADKTRDKDVASSFVVTFNDPQECGAALMILNNTKLGGRVISLQMGPVNN